MSNIVPLQSFPEAELIACLQARQWWNACNGTEPDELVLCTTAPLAARSTALVRSSLVEQRALHRDAPVMQVSPTIEARPAQSPARRSAGRVILALVLALAAIGLAVVGLTVNTRFAASFGQTAEAALLLAAIGLTIDLLAIVLPSAAAQLWRDRNVMSAAAAWSIWVIALGMTLLAAIGFAATNIGDGVAGRSRLAAEAGALAADATRLRAERAGLAEERAVATIEAEIQRAQPAAAAVWKQTAGCSDVTLAASGAACAEVLKLRRALGVAQRRDALDAELRAVEARLAPLPAITTSDPQATMAADIVGWISGGHVSLTPHDIHRMRVTGLTIIPALAGIIFMFAATLLRTARR